jgi:hypothetical protein
LKFREADEHCPYRATIFVPRDFQMSISRPSTPRFGRRETWPIQAAIVLFVDCRTDLGRPTR